MMTFYRRDTVWRARAIGLGTAAGACLLVAILPSCSNTGAPGPSTSQVQPIAQPERFSPAVRKVPFVRALTPAEIEEAKAEAERLKTRSEEVKWWKSRAGKWCAEHPGWSREVCGMVLAHRIQMGMTTEQVRASWGRPYQINRTVTGSHTHEQWVVHEDGNTYLYFDDGVLTSWQNSDD